MFQRAECAFREKEDLGGGLTFANSSSLVNIGCALQMNFFYLRKSIDFPPRPPITWKEIINRFANLSRKWCFDSYQEVSLMRPPSPSDTNLFLPRQGIWTGFKSDRHQLPPLISIFGVIRLSFFSSPHQFLLVGEIRRRLYSIFVYCC